MLKPKELKERATELSRTNLLFIFGIIKAASIGVAVTVFLQIFLHLNATWSWFSIFEHLPIAILWAVSYSCLLVTFDVAMFASIFLFHIPKKSESFFTFLLVGTEALQFAILSPQLEKEAGKATVMSVFIVDWWYIIFCFYLIFTFFLLYFGKKEIKKTLFHIKTEQYINLYLKNYKRAILIIFFAFIVSSGTFIALVFFCYGKPNWITTVKITSSLILLGILFYSFFMQHTQRELIEKKLQEE